MTFLIIWAVMIVGEFIIAILSLAKVRKLYPWFTTLVCVMAVKSVALYYVRAFHPENYFYAYYRLEFLASFLQLAATVEVFGTLFRPLWTVPKNSLITLGLATATSVAVATHTNVVMSAGGEIAFYRAIDRIVAFSVAITLSAALLFARHFEMPFRSRLKGIATGLYVMAVTSVITTLVLSHSGLVLMNSLALMPVLAHYGVLAIWTYHVGRREVLVAEFQASDVPFLRQTLNELKIAVGNTPTSCALTLGKKRAQSIGKEKAKVVINL